MAFASCSDLPGDKGEDNIAAEDVAPPAWMPPAGPDRWLMHEPEAETLASQTTHPPVDQPEHLPERDTINGIAVRSPGLIVIPPEKPGLQGSGSGLQARYAISYVSTNSYFGLTFDNDIFSNTDYYYTNGICFELTAPIFASSPLAFPMLPYRKESMNYHGMKMVQNMYTPTNPDTVMVMDGDRPFAAYLYIGHFKNTLSKRKRYRQYSEIIIGLIGPGSLGGFVQSQIHDIEPVGWTNQIRNDLVLNYTAVVEKGILNPPYFDLNLFAEGQAGTLYDNIGAGIRVRAGKLNPYFSMPLLANKNSAEGRNALPLQYGITACAQLNGVLYDATLQGGWFNKHNNYTIDASNIQRIVLQANIGLYFAWNQVGITYKHHYISPEFKNAKHHQWGHINVSYCF